MFTVSAEDCKNPMLNATFNPGRAPANGGELFGADPVLGENLPVCGKRLNGKMLRKPCVLCIREKEEFTEIKIIRIIEFFG